MEKERERERELQEATKHYITPSSSLAIAEEEISQAAAKIRVGGRPDSKGDARGRGRPQLHGPSFNERSNSELVFFAATTGGDMVGWTGGRSSRNRVATATGATAATSGTTRDASIGAFLCPTNRLSQRYATYASAINGLSEMKTPSKTHRVIEPLGAVRIHARFLSRSPVRFCVRFAD
jgi:hypothetical protein